MRLEDPEDRFTLALLTLGIVYFLIVLYFGLDY